MYRPDAERRRVCRLLLTGDFTATRSRSLNVAFGCPPLAMAEP